MSVSSRDFATLMRVYDETGIVTRLDIISMDSRSWARKAFSMLSAQREGAQISEARTEGYGDYSDVIYNSDIYTNDEVKAYMEQYVLLKK